MMSGFIKLKETLTRLLGFALMVAVAVLVLSVCWGVFTRYVMNNQAQWTEEIARFLLIWISLLGGAVAFGTKGHLGVDFLVEKFHPDAKKVMAITVHLTVLIFAAAIFIYGGSQVVADALKMEQTTPALGWKMGYVYSALPISGFFMVLFTIENLIETWTGASGAVPDVKPAGGLE
ncbi:MAG: TRAP transporter small permease [Pontiellaceae bacterium]|jgi:TRAP-type C4-dicarboxylate transport system permease small subunit|nr:TRAP transporter small permease [Pontiellaceae bacterium]